MAASSSSTSPIQPNRPPARASSPPPSSSNKKPINLLRGWPSASLLPTQALQRCTSAALTTPSIATPALLYGPDSGYQPLRESLASWLSRFYGTAEDANRIAITGGASQSVACILQSFTDPSYTRAVWMVAPCYYLACPIFADSGFQGRLRAVPEDSEGIDLEWLGRGLLRMDQEDVGAGGRARDERGIYKDPAPYRKVYRHVIYCVPSFSNPSGRTMSLRRRTGLVHLARKYDALVIGDDVYDMLQWPSAAPGSASASELPSPSVLSKRLLPRLVDIDSQLGATPHDPPGQHFGHAVSNGTFSKLVAPGMRTGWTDSTPDFALGVSQTGSTRSGGAPSQFSAAVLAEMLASGLLDAHLESTLKPAYQRRHAKLMGAVRRVLVPLGAEVQLDSLDAEGGEGVFGGYFVWMRFPSGPRARDVADRCREEEGLAIGCGDLFEVHGDEEAVRFETAIRLCFAWEDEGDLVEGVERLGRVIQKLREEDNLGISRTTGMQNRSEVNEFK